MWTFYGLSIRMKCIFRQFVSARPRPRDRGFTLVEIVAALAILAGIISSALVVMNHAVESTIEMRSRQHAFEVARENLESLLTTTSVSDSIDYGYSELYPEIKWELRVEPFYEPISNKMWIRAVSTATYRNSADEDQTIELQQWLTGLNAAQIKQILDQQNTEEKILEELYNDKDSEIQEITKLYLRQQGLNVTAYEGLLKRQRREKLDYLLDEGFGDGYQELVDTMEGEESVLLQELGVDFDQLDAYITYLLENKDTLSSIGSGGGSETDSRDPNPSDPTPSDPTPSDPKSVDPCAELNCADIPAQFKPMFCQLLHCCCE